MSTIYWLRNDLRLHDNECLQRALATDQALLMVYCFDPRQYRILSIGFKKTGYLRFKFLEETLIDLRQNIEAKGGKLLIVQGEPEVVLPKLVEKLKANFMFFQKEIASEECAVEDALTQSLAASKCSLKSIWGKTLYHLDDAPFKASETPLTSKAFRTNLTKKASVRDLIATPDNLSNIVELPNWGKLPTASSFGFSAEEIQQPVSSPFQGGETAALNRLQYYTFGQELLTSYRWTRNRSLGMDYSSKFSPWMALGSLSPRKIYWEVKRYEKEVKKNISTWWLIFEVIWRDYFKFSAMRHGNKIFSKGGIKNRDTEWHYDQDLFDRWRWGQTGIPFVDAHLRQLNQTGFMSNRGRVNCASFLTRDYKIDWRWGAAWFETQLLDYDVCSNWLNWNTQATEIWYTNPVHQGYKYDKEGKYVKTWLPELKAVDLPLVQAPWLMTEEQQKKYQVINYPDPHEVYKKWTRSINNILKAST
ncbi:MAG: DASH family cryptochrome [Saprospiraceae bacterium]